MHAGQSCGNCHFASDDVSVDDDDYEMLFCQRFPPTLRDDSGSWHQPLVADVDWCGEWRLKEGAAPP